MGAPVALASDPLKTEFLVSTDYIRAVCPFAEPFFAYTGWFLPPIPCYNRQRRLLLDVYLLSLLASQGTLLCSDNLKCHGPRHSWWRWTCCYAYFYLRAYVDRTLLFPPPSWCHCQHELSGGCLSKLLPAEELSYATSCSLGNNNPHYVFTLIMKCLTLSMF